MVWNMTDLAFLKNESGLHIFFNHSTSKSLYSEVIFSGSLKRWSFQVWAKKISAAYVYKVVSFNSSKIFCYHVNLPSSSRRYCPNPLRSRGNIL